MTNADHVLLPGKDALVSLAFIWHKCLQNGIYVPPPRIATPMLSMVILYMDGLCLALYLEIGNECPSQLVDIPIRLDERLHDDSLQFSL